MPALITLTCRIHALSGMTRVAASPPSEVACLLNQMRSVGEATLATRVISRVPLRFRLYHCPRFSLGGRLGLRNYSLGAASCATGRFIISLQSLAYY